MTIKQLKKELEKYPEHMDVFLGERTTDFTYGLLENVSCRKINMKEEPDGKTLAKDTVIVLEEF